MVAVYIGLLWNDMFPKDEEQEKIMPKLEEKKKNRAEFYEDLK